MVVTPVNHDGDGTVRLVATRGRRSHHRQVAVQSSPLPVGDATAIPASRSTHARAPAATSGTGPRGTVARSTTTASRLASPPPMGR